MNTSVPSWNLRKHLYIVVCISSIPILILILSLRGTTDVVAAAAGISIFGGFAIFFGSQLFIITNIIRSKKIQRGYYNKKTIFLTYMLTSLVLTITTPFEMIFARFIYHEVKRAMTLNQLKKTIQPIARSNYQISNFDGDFICPKDVHQTVKNCMRLYFDLTVSQPGTYRIHGKAEQEQNGNTYYGWDDKNISFGANETKLVDLLLTDNEDKGFDYKKHYVQIQISKSGTNFYNVTNKTRVSFEHPDFDTLGSDEDHIYHEYSSYRLPVLYDSSLMLYKN